MWIFLSYVYVLRLHSVRIELTVVADIGPFLLKIFIYKQEMVFTKGCNLSDILSVCP